MTDFVVAMAVLAFVAFLAACVWDALTGDDE